MGGSAFDAIDRVRNNIDVEYDRAGIQHSSVFVCSVRVSGWERLVDKAPSVTRRQFRKMQRFYTMGDVFTY